jgi:Glycosyl transferase family 2
MTRFVMPEGAKWPSVTCICITRNRRVFMRRAIYYFARSATAYGFMNDAELIILDGSKERQDVLPTLDDTGVRYFHRPGSFMQAGIAHNECCEWAKGDIIIQWDDDDWQHPDRITRQVQTLLQTPGDGFAYTSRYYWYHLQQGQAVKAKSWEGGEGSTGATFAYWRETWKKTPFQDVGVGEDTFFQVDLRARGCPMLDAKDPELLVYVRHNQNGSALTNYRFSEEDTKGCRKLMGSDLDFYDGIGELMPVANWNHPNAPGSKMHIMSPLQQQWAKHFR